MGAPTVVADFKLTDANSQVAARLLDVDPTTATEETLVARGLWRPKTDPGFVKQVFQLHPERLALRRRAHRQARAAAQRRPLRPRLQRSAAGRR